METKRPMPIKYFFSAMCKLASKGDWATLRMAVAKRKQWFIENGEKDNL